MYVDCVDGAQDDATNLLTSDDVDSDTNRFQSAIPPLAGAICAGGDADFCRLVAPEDRT